MNQLIGNICRMFSSIRPRSATILKHHHHLKTPSRRLATINTGRQFSTALLAQSPDPKSSPSILLQDKENGFGFARSNPRPKKPRMKGVTEIRGPYYSVLGFRLCDFVYLLTMRNRLWESGIWLMYLRREPFLILKQTASSKR